jgi:hypothetical protein
MLVSGHVCGCCGVSTKVTCVRAQHVDDLVRLADDRERDVRELQLMRLDARHVEQVVDHRQQVVRTVWRRKERDTIRRA